MSNYMERHVQADNAFLEWMVKMSKNVVHIADAWYAAVKWADSHPNWIPVKEEQPKENGRYWCCDDDGGQEELKWSDGHWYGLLDPYPIEGITHWMPLPPLPGKEE